VRQCLSPHSKPSRALCLNGTIMKSKVLLPAFPVPSVLLTWTSELHPHP
jgi:hypothetical protein